MKDEHSKYMELLSSEDYKDAYALARDYAEDGFAYYQTKLGWAYFHGFGCTQNYSESRKWFSSAAEQNELEAIHGLASILKTQKRYSEALSFYEKAGEGRFPPAILNIGNFYYNGLSVPVDKSFALIRYLEAAELGNIVAKRNFAFMLTKGHGGLIGRLKVVPLYLIVAIQSFQVGFNNPHDIRLMC